MGLTTTSNNNSDKSSIHKTCLFCHRGGQPASAVVLSHKAEQVVSVSRLNKSNHSILSLLYCVRMATIVRDSTALFSKGDHPIEN